MNVIMVALAITLAGQLAAAAHRRTAISPDFRFIIPAIGSKMVDVTLRADTGEETYQLSSAISKDTCTLIVACDSRCAACRRMRYSWAESFRAWRDTVSLGVKPLWLMFDDSAAVEEFYQGYDFADVDKARVAADVERLRHKVGLVVTPMYYLLDHDGRLQWMSAKATLPPQAVIMSHCITRT
jgi:hypothetical protein